MDFQGNLCTKVPLYFCVLGVPSGHHPFVVQKYPLYFCVLGPFGTHPTPYTSGTFVLAPRATPFVESNYIAKLCYKLLIYCVAGSQRVLILEDFNVYSAGFNMSTNIGYSKNQIKQHSGLRI